MMALLGVLLLLAGPAAAMSAAEQLPDPTAENRARRLMTELRCVTCPAQSVADSQAALAQDLRRLVRERVAAGMDDAAIRALLRERYGDAVFLAPPLRAATWPLWLMPLILLLCGGVLLWKRR